MKKKPNIKQTIAILIVLLVAVLAYDVVESQRPRPRSPLKIYFKGEERAVVLYDQSKRVQKNPKTGVTETIPGVVPVELVCELPNGSIKSFEIDVTKVVPPADGYIFWGIVINEKGEVTYSAVSVSER